MPIHDLGYRPWTGELSPVWLRWLTIAKTGVRLAWRAQWLRRLVVLAWVPALYGALVFFAYETSESRWAREVLEPLLPREIHREAWIDPAGVRVEAWRRLFLFFFRYPQAILMLLVVGLVAPPLIAHDSRSRAFLLYFSRPLARIDYLVGKLAIITFYGAAITTLPALLLYIFAALLSPDLSVVADTWDLPLRVVGASIVLMLPTASLALLFSSLTTEGRYAAFGWFAAWILGFVGYVALEVAAGRVVAQPDSVSPWTFISIYHSLGQAEAWVFGVQTRAGVGKIVYLSIVAALSLAIVYRRISSPMRAS